MQIHLPFAEIAMPEHTSIKVPHLPPYGHNYLIREVIAMLKYLIAIVCIAPSATLLASPIIATEAGLPVAEQLRKAPLTAGNALQIPKGYRFEGQILKADDIIFEQGSGVIFSESSRYPWVAIVAKRVLFRAPDVTSSVSLEPAGKLAPTPFEAAPIPPGTAFTSCFQYKAKHSFTGNEVTLRRCLPDVRQPFFGGPSKAPKGSNGRNGDDGPSGTSGSQRLSAYGSPPAMAGKDGTTLYIVVGALLNKEEKPLPKALNLEVAAPGGVGQDGTSGQIGYPGRDGEDGGDGEMSSTNPFVCDKRAGRGGWGGRGGEGGDGQLGGNGGRGSEVLIYAPTVPGTQLGALDSLKYAKFSQIGGQPGLGGLAGPNGAQGIRGARGSKPGICNLNSETHSPKAYPQRPRMQSGRSGPSGSLNFFPVEEAEIRNLFE